MESYIFFFLFGTDGYSELYTIEDGILRWLCGKERKRFLGGENGINKKHGTQRERAAPFREGRQESSMCEGEQGKSSRDRSMPLMEGLAWALKLGFHFINEGGSFKHSEQERSLIVAVL